ncbi:MAG: LPS export ABC transporter periplasmic protein LptC [Gammaproteobacteria bacterium]|nr:MAG: LPS export ABC transporter periplasmic protein LptC [Gammaproteobacteria bacterium]
MTQNNWRGIGLLLILLVLVFIQHFGQKPRHAPPSASLVQNKSPDYTIEKFSSSVFNADGSLKYIIEANRLDHFPTGDTTELQQPLIKLFQPNKPTWFIQAQTGQSTQMDVIELAGDVTIFGETGTQRTPVKMLAENLTLHVDRKYAETQDQVTIATTSDTIRSLGLQADFANDSLKFMSKVRAKHVTPH